MYKFPELFHDGRRGKTVFNPQFCEISEREDTVYVYFEWFSWDKIAQKNQSLYKRRKRKGMCIFSIDSLAEIWGVGEVGRREIPTTEGAAIPQESER